MLFTPHRTINAENVDALLVGGILSTDVAPFPMSITVGAGAQFPSVYPFFVTLAKAAETETGPDDVVETFEIENRVGDTLTVSAREQAGTVAQDWDIGDKVQMRLSAEHIHEIQDALTSNRPANQIFAGPTTGIDAPPDFRIAVADDIPNLEALNGTLDVTRGGTGRTSATLGSLLLGAGTAMMTLLAPGPVGYVVVSDGTTWTSAANPSGEIATAANVNTAGVGVFKQKTGTEFEFRGINAGSVRITITDDAANNEIDIDVDEASLDLANMGGTLGVTQGGTGLTSAALGDTFYGSAANVISKLPGNITTTRMIMIQSGDGAISAAPAWDVLEAGDIPTHSHSGGDITSGVVLAAVGGTGQSTWVLGDILASNGADSLARVSGNVTTARKYLSQIGTGVVSALPIWTTIVANDLPVFGPSGPLHTQGAVPDPGATPGTTKYLREDATWDVPPGTSGTVTSVALTMPAGEFAVAGTPITGAGTFAVTWDSQVANIVLASPDGAPGTPSFRALVAADIPNLSAAKITSGTLAVARGGTNSGAALNNDRIMVSAGGAIVEAGAMTDGQILIGDTGGAPVVANLIAGAGILITDGAGTITIEATASGAPAGAEYVVLSLDATLTDERVLTGTANKITITDGGAGAAVTLNIGTDVVTLTGAQTLTNKILSDSTTSIVDNGDPTKILQFQVSGVTTATTRTMTVPDVNGTLITSGNLTGIVATGTVASGVWNGTAIAEGFGGTGQTTYVLGDILFSDGANSLDKLAGNTTAVKQYLSQTGNGAISAAPAWATISAADIGAGTLPIARGGTALGTTPTNGQLLVGNGTNYTLATITAGTGISVTNGAGTITITATASGGTVTSVDIDAPAELTVGSNPITTSGTITLTWANQTQNKVFASPNGSTGTPAFRALVAADIPNLDAAKITTGSLAVTRGGTGTGTYALGDILYSDASNSLAKLTGNITTARQFFSQTGDGAASAAPVWVALADTDIPNLNTSKLTAGTLGIARGGTGLGTTPTNGQLLIGNGTNYTLAALTAGAGITINNTAGAIEIVATGSGGTVTSVGLAMPTAEFNIASSPITGSGAITVTWDSQNQNLVLASPDSSSGVPSFRALVSGDMPDFSTAKLNSGTLPIVRGGTNSAVALNSNRIMVSSAGAIVEAAALTDGQLLIGDTGAAPVAATLSQGANIGITNGAGTITIGVNPIFADSTFRIADNVDATKLLAFQISGFTTGTTRTLTPPNYDGTIATIDGVETLTNKTLSTGTKVNIGSDATGDLWYRGPTGELTRIPIGTAGYILTVVAGIPTWVAP